MISRKTTQADIENKRSTLRALGFIASLSLVLIALSWTSYDVITRQALNYEADLLEDEEIPINIVTPPPPPPPPQQTTVIEIVDDEEEIEIELEIEDIELDEDTEIEIIEEDDDVADDTPFMIVENMPALAQCKTMRGDERHQCTQMEIIKYVSKNTTYPPIAKDAGIQGTVFVYFVVGKDGIVKDVKVLREVDSRLDKEAKRVVESLPRFDPGSQRGKNVSVQYTIPVKFIIR
ncbi:MAG: energy transducer TonB [Bacteroidetes bacterium]|jgi:periplasmic protein TonB|nr:energy transducer TonB [Bacteroidota bacterium]MDA1382342.1 energy transducer TonB [Bacteroidota bacterium]